MSKPARKHFLSIVSAFQIYFRFCKYQVVRSCERKHACTKLSAFVLTLIALYAFTKALKTNVPYIPKDKTVNVLVLCVTYFFTNNEYTIV